MADDFESRKSSGWSGGFYDNFGDPPRYLSYKLIFQFCVSFVEKWLHFNVFVSGITVGHMVEEDGVVVVIAAIEGIAIIAIAIQNPSQQNHPLLLL